MNIEIIHSYLKREKIFLIINFSLIILILFILKILPVSKIILPLVDSAYLSCIENDNRVSRQFPSLQKAGYAVFKRLKLNLPFSINGPAPIVKINARTTGNILNYQLIINRQYTGAFHINTRHYFLFEPEIDKVPTLNNNYLKIILNFNKPATKTPWFFVNRIGIYTNDSKTILTRNWSYIFSVFLLPILLIILISICLKNILIKYFLSLTIISAFFLTGLLSIPSTLALRTVLLPVLIAALIFILMLIFLKKALQIEKKHIAAGVIIFALGMSFWSVLMFHPGHYHPDLKTHIYWGLSAFEQRIGDFSAEYSFFQMNALLLVNAPFPYSPSFYIAVKLLSGEPADVIFWIRFLPILMTVFAAPLIFLLTRKLSGSDAAGIWSAAAYLISGITVLRILYFFCPALWGTFFITAAMLLVCWRSEYYDQERSIRSFIPEIAAITIGLLAYPAGPFTLGIFAVTLLLFWSTASGKKTALSKSWLKVFIPSFSLALFLYYIWFIPELITKVIPKMKQGAFGSANPELSESLWSRFQGLLGISVIIILGLIGFAMLLLKSRNKILRTIIASWGISWLLLFITRFIPYAKTLFKFSKDELFLLPLLSICLGYLIIELWSGKTYKKVFAVTVCLVLLAGFLLKIAILIPRLYIP